MQCAKHNVGHIFISCIFIQVCAYMSTNIWNFDPFHTIMYQIGCHLHVINMENAFSEKAKLEHNLLVVPADGFGCPGYFRLSYCVSNDMIRRSLPAFRAMMEECR